MVYMSIFIEHWWQPRAWSYQTKISKQAQICAESCEAVPVEEAKSNIGKNGPQDFKPRGRKLI